MVLKRESSAGYMCNWAARLFARELERQLAPSGIASAYMPVMFALADNKALTQKALARQAAVEQPTMAATLNRMARDGLIERRPDPADRRSALIMLTPLAQSKIETVEQVVRRINTLALAPLVPAEQQQFTALLGKVIAVLEARDTSLDESR